MHQRPNVHVYTCILQDCIRRHALGEGKQTHHLIIQNGLHTDVFVGSTLIHMYSRCGCLEEAVNVFDRLPSRTIVTWGVMISAYAHHGQGLSALNLFNKMQLQRVPPDKVIHICMLKASGSIKSSMHGMSTHAHVLKCGLESDVVIGSAIVDMYAKCGPVEASRNAFDKMPTRNIVSWSAMISSYVQHGDGSSALDLYRKMRNEGLKPNKFIMSSILKACGLIGDFTLGKQVHEEIGQLNLESDVVLGNALVDMYAKFGRLHKAYEVFSALPHRNVVSWGALIAGYVHHGCSDRAIELFMEMQQTNIEPNLVTYSCILQACGNAGCLGSGMLVHDKIIRDGSGADDVVVCSLVDMYAKCGGLMDGCKLLDGIPKNIAAWGAMMSGCVEHEEPYMAIKLFEKLLQHGVEPNKVLCLCIIRACGSVRFCNQGMLVHSLMVALGLENDVVIETSLVDMFAKCGSLEDARKIFGTLRHQDVVTWGTMIVGHVQQGHDLCALQLFEDMQQAGTRPSNIIFPSVLKACGNLGALMQGRLINDLINRSEFEADSIIQNSLVEMYNRCGSSEDAQQIYEKLDTSLWNDLSGRHTERRQCMMETQRKGLMRHNTSSSDVLLESTNVCQVDQTSSMFSPSTVIFALAPNADDFNHMISDLGRSGSLMEAKHLLQTMPMLPDDIGWTSLLTSCRTYGDKHLGRQCYDQAVPAVAK